MKKALLIILILAVYQVSCKRNEVSHYVDPNIGSVAPLLTTKVPTVHRPHSMVRVFPITKPGLNDRYLSDRIYGFTVNMPAYRMGYLTELMPTTGKLQLNRNEYASMYDHAQEEVHPWYHMVLLEDYGITAEWTTTERAVIYRFDFGDNDTCNIIFRSSNNSGFNVTGDNIISGWEEFEKTRQYFYAEFSRPFDKKSSFRQGVTGTETSSSGRNSGIIASWLSSGHPVEVRIGISYIDEKQAAANLKKEAGTRNFNEIKQESHDIWSAALGKIKVEGGTERQKRIFYTSLYRSMERMVNISEDGRYFSGYDNKVHTDTIRPFYVDDWLWDTYRSLHPLMRILDPERQADMVESYITMYEQSGWMPGFPQFYGDFPAMIGFHTAPLVWDTWQKGVRNISVEKAYEGLRKNAMEGTMLPWRMGPGCILDSLYHEIGRAHV